MLFNGRALIFTFSGTQVRIAEHERLQSLFKTSMTQIQILYNSDKDNVLILKTHNVDLVYILATYPQNLYRPYNAY